MTTIQVCVGSACHLKGSYNVINALQDQVNQHDAGGRVFIKALFCLDHCSKAVSVKIDDEEQIYSVSEKTVGEFFAENIVPRMK